MRFVGLVVYHRYCSTTRQYAFIWDCLGLEQFDRNIDRQGHEVKALIFGKNPSVARSSPSLTRSPCSYLKEPASNLIAAKLWKALVRHDLAQVVGLKNAAEAALQYLHDCNPGDCNFVNDFRLRRHLSDVRCDHADVKSGSLL